MNHNDLRNTLALLSVRCIGPVRFKSLLAEFGSAQSVFTASFDQLCEVEDIGASSAREILSWDDWKAVDRILADCERHSIEIVPITDARKYPGALRGIADPPPIIFVKGEFRLEDQAAIAVVGTRNHSPYGETAAAAIAGELALCGMTIVSGMAMGIDSLAHRAALQAGGRTIAVFGCGLDVIYPSENRRLAEGIVESGALVSEYPPGVGPLAENFPRRNRIISGMSLGTVVVEAGPKSGALLTADLALKQGRKVWAVPGHIFGRQSKGCNALIKNGARLIESADDIIDELGFVRPERGGGAIAVGQEGTAGRLEFSGGSGRGMGVKLTESEKAVFEKLSYQPIHIDRLSADLEMTSARISATLLELELKGVVRRLAGMNFVKA